MKCRFLVPIALLVVCLSASGRLVHAWSDAELESASDLVVVAYPEYTFTLLETNALGWTGSASFQPKFRGVETQFRILDIFKGSPATDKITMHHYTMEAGWGCPPNGPMFVDFTSGGSRDTNSYLLYLVKDGPDRYAPTTGQVDPQSSIRPASRLPAEFKGRFSILPPIADAHPWPRHPLPISLPTQLTVEKTKDAGFVSFDTNSMIVTNLTVGTNMVVGVRIETAIVMTHFPQGMLVKNRSLTSGTNAFTGWIWRTRQAAESPFHLPDLQHTIMVDVEIFETDVPPQHEWNPYGRKYKTLWQQTLSRIIE